MHWLAREKNGVRIRNENRKHKCHWHCHHQLHWIRSRSKPYRSCTCLSLYCIQQDQWTKTRRPNCLFRKIKSPKQNQEQKIPRIPIIKGLKKTVSTMHLDTVEELSLRILTLQCIHCWIKNLIPAVDPTHTQPKTPKSLWWWWWWWWWLLHSWWV